MSVLTKHFKITKVELGVHLHYYIEYDASNLNPISKLSKPTKENIRPIVSCVLIAVSTSIQCLNHLCVRLRKALLAPLPIQAFNSLLTVNSCTSSSNNVIYQKRD